VTLTSTGGSIIIDGAIDSGSTVTLNAATVIRVGFAGSTDDEKKIDGSSRLSATTGGDISIGGKIDNNCNVSLTSTQGSISVGGKIDGSSVVRLQAAGDIRIGETANDGAERKIDGNSDVDAQAGGTIHLYNKIDGGNVSGGHSTVSFRACRGITIGDKIDGGSIVSLAVSSGTITVGDKIGGGGTTVTAWPVGSVDVTNAIEGTLTYTAWTDPSTWCVAQPKGYYWRNWPQTFGYVAPQRFYPRSVEDVASAIQLATRAGQTVKAVGGGWSFSDASMPMTTQSEVDTASILKRGADGVENLSHVLQGLGGVTNSPADLQPQNVIAGLAASRRYDQPSLRQVTESGANLPFVNNVAVIDTRGLAASLQDQLFAIMSDTARAAVTSPGNGQPPQTYLFHVEAGILMADLDTVLDHQHPRLALGASGGSVGATLAGTMSTATHGAEFSTGLLIDRVRAIHFVGPGGQQWWIEGATSIADLTRLQQNGYPLIDSRHFITGSNHLGRIAPRDVLNAVIVSMGTMGVIYSVVLEVVPQFGLQQISKAYPATDTVSGWATVVSQAGTTLDALRAGDPSANTAVLDFLLNGTANGTGVGLSENVFCDLAVNPLNLDTWVTNRRVTDELPVDAESPGPDWQSVLSRGLAPRAADTVGTDRGLGRVFDFLGWATDISGPIPNPDDVKNDAEQAIRLASYITSFPDINPRPPPSSASRRWRTSSTPPTTPTAALRS